MSRLRNDSHTRIRMPLLPCMRLFSVHGLIKPDSRYKVRNGANVKGNGMNLHDTRKNVFSHSNTKGRKGDANMLSAQRTNSNCKEKQARLDGNTGKIISMFRGTIITDYAADTAGRNTSVAITLYSIKDL